MGQRRSAGAADRIYLFGVWLSILLAIGVTSLYAFQVTEEARSFPTRCGDRTWCCARAASDPADALPPPAATNSAPRCRRFPDLARTGEDGAGQPFAGDLKMLREQASAAARFWADHPALLDRRAPFDRMKLST